MRKGRINMTNWIILIIFTFALLGYFNHKKALTNLIKGKAMIERFFSPGYSYCHRCKRPWTVVTEHSTPYTKGRSCFPLCEKCWKELTPEERLPYYRRLWQSWEDSKVGYANWEDIKKAVLKGL